MTRAIGTVLMTTHRSLSATSFAFVLLYLLFQNRRDFDLRYGNAYRHPYGVQEPRQGRPTKRYRWTLDATLGLLALIVAALYAALA